MFILKINFVSQYLSISSFNAKLIIVLSIIPLYIYYRERKNLRGKHFETEGVNFYKFL